MKFFILTSNCYPIELGSARPYPVKPVYWHQVTVKESAAIYCRVPSQESRQLVLRRPELSNGFQGKVFKDRMRGRVAGCMISSWTFFWLVGGEVMGSHHHRPSGSNRSGIFVLVGSIQLISSTWWRLQYLPNSTKDMAQNNIDSPWGGNKGLWLCLMVKLLLFCLAWLFSFASAFFSFLWLNVFSGTLGKA